MKARTTIRVKKIEMKPHNVSNPKPEGIQKTEMPIPSPTMLGLEDVDGRFVYYGTSVMEVFFPNPPNLTEAQAASIQTFPCLNQNKAALPHLVELAKNDNPRPQTNRDIKRPERGKILNNGSIEQNINMGSHKETTQKPDRVHPDVLSRLKHRGRLSEIANKRRLESNDNQGHPLLDKNIVRYKQSTPT